MQKILCLFFFLTLYSTQGYSSINELNAELNELLRVKNIQVEQLVLDFNVKINAIAQRAIQNSTNMKASIKSAMREYKDLKDGKLKAFKIDVKEFRNNAYNKIKTYIETSPETKKLVKQNAKTSRNAIKNKYKQWISLMKRTIKYGKDYIVDAITNALSAQLIYK